MAQFEPVRIAPNLSSQRMSAHLMCYTSTGTARAGSRDLPYQVGEGRQGSTPN